MLLELLSLWQPSVVPPTPPKPRPRFEKDGAGTGRLEPRWKQIEARNEDDLEVVKILTEFLSRQ